MARRKRVYSKRRRINYRRIVLLAGAIVILLLIILRVFKKDSYISYVEDALNSEITNMTGAISTVSKIDATVYENNGFRYTNQHEGIKKHVTFDGSLFDDGDKVSKVKIILENLLKSEKTEVLAELPAKDNGYYWLEADILVKSKALFFTKENKYNFDLYYDIENKEIYVKEKYYDEFSKKYNKTKFQGYKATGEFTTTLEEILKNSGDGPLNSGD